MKPAQFELLQPTSRAEALAALAEQPDDTVILPGHNYGDEPESRLDVEKKTNPFLLCDSIDSFLELTGIVL